jgi:ABC-type branched-subunit amino acid transport system substrate-binding protein
VNGRNIELTFRCFNVLSPEDQRATAVDLVQDKKVFAVVAHCCFKDGSEVVAGEMRTPVVSVDSVLQSSYQRGAPFLFTAGVALEKEARNFVPWLKEQNLAGKKVGIYYYQDQYSPAVANIIKSELAKLGNNNTVLFSTDNQVGGPNDSLAVQRFSSEHVEVVVLMTSANGFTQAAATQRFKPQYVQADFGLPTLTDTSTAAYDQDNFDGALGMTQQRVGEWRSPPLAKATQECQDNYFKYTGQRIDGPSNESTWGALLYACDVMNLAFQGIQKAGRDLTPQTFVHGLEQVNLEGARFGGLSYSPTKHDGATQIRTIKWTKDCHCFRIQGPFHPFSVP